MFVRVLEGPAVAISSLCSVVLVQYLRYSPLWPIRMSVTEPL